MQRLWDRGEVLRAGLQGEPLFPKQLRLRRPTAKDLGAEDHGRLNGDVRAILAKASFRTSGLLAGLRRALPKRGGD